MAQRTKKFLFERSFDDPNKLYLPGERRRAEIEAAEAAAVATSEPRLVIRAHSMIVEDLEARLQDVMARSGFRGTFSVVADYELQPGDCRIEWDGGGADRDEVRIWREISAAMAATFGDVNV